MSFGWRYSPLCAGYPWQTEETRPQRLWGGPPNLLHASAPLDMLSLRQFLESFRALYFSQTGNESSGILSAPSTGHKHDEGSGQLFGTLDVWRQLGSYRPWNLAGGTGGVTISATSLTPLLFLGLLVPAGATSVIPRAKLSATGTGLSTVVSVALRLAFFAPANLNSATPDKEITIGLSSGAGAGETRQGWVEGSRVDLSGIATTHGRRLVFLRVEGLVTSSNALWSEFQLVLPEETREPTPVELDTALLVPNASTISAAIPKQLWLDNFAYGRKLIFGVLEPPVSVPHDHGAQRGETLDRVVLSTTYGPPLTTTPLGIPIHEAQSGVTISTTSPKLLTQEALWVQGQIQTVYLHVAARLPGSGTKTAKLKVEVRPLGDSGYSTPAANRGLASSEQTLTQVGTGQEWVQTEVSLDLSTLGAIGRDRLYELCVWQTAATTAGIDGRLLGTTSYPGTNPTALSEPLSLKGDPKERLSLAQLKAGQIGQSILGAKSSLTLRQLATEALGGYPGDTVNRPWRVQLKKPHQHRGKRYTDEIGDIVNDGAVIRAPLWQQYFGAAWGEDGSSPTKVDATPALGQLLHSTGTLSAWFYPYGICSIPKGLGAIDIYGLIQPLHVAQLGRLFCFVKVEPIEVFATGSTATAIHTSAQSGRYHHTASLLGPTTGFLACQVDPVEGVAWQSVTERLKRGLGNWTEDALLANQPSGISTTNIGRWTQAVRVYITPRATEHCVISVRYALQDTADPLLQVSSGWVATSRCLEILAVPADGY